ncbi:MAG: tyrosine--tRNA ligase [Epsilonproteobacteria bacterium]|nr:tyrosine--tRNA ligase [Campylobacterota bacterium]
MSDTDNQLSELLRGSVDVVERAELENRLKRSAESKIPLVVKAGFDPTAPDLHLGHTVLLNKLHQFQKFGHRVIFVVGDFTARIGDPTGKSGLRPPLSEDLIKQNAETYTQQAYKILDPDKTEVKYNSSWLGILSSKDIINLMTSMTVSRMLERDDFKRRFRSEKAIYLHEMLYPLLQGYDSVAIKADIELGGTDQLFNLLVGRSLQKLHNQKPQIVMTLPLLEGTDGKNKMSKSLGNYIGITEDPNTQFGKTMSIPDEIMWRYFTLVSSFDGNRISELKSDVANDKIGMKEAKETLASDIVERFWGKDKAHDAKLYFNQLFSKGQIPEDIEQVDIKFDADLELATLLRDVGLVKSRSEAKRKIREGAVRIDGNKIELLPKTAQTIVIKLGKKIIKVNFV